MEEIAFNLLEEPWIRVMTEDCSVQECSLTQALVDSHKYRRLAGELPTQDVAVLRLMLAVLQTVFYRYDGEGNEDLTEERGPLLKRWTEAWQKGKMPEGAICTYLDAWRERFWLFHPERPFYQVPEAKSGTAYTAAKLNGALSESSNKIRLFSDRSGTEKTSLSYGEAARWLLHVNGFDDTSAKPKTKGLPSPGAGWLGQLGLIWAEGANLFETLMLNLVLLGPDRMPWEAPKPVWELEKPRSGERTEIALPENQAELLTLQSRRLLLIREKGRVTGYNLLGGDFFSKVNAIAEQMTIWRKVQGKKNEPDFLRPRRWTPERQAWRDFGVITGTDDKKTPPGVVRWVALLRELRTGLDSDRVLHFRTAGASYGDKDFFVADIMQDYLDFHRELLDEMGKPWLEIIQKKISQTDQVAGIVGRLAEGLYLAGGGQAEDKAREASRERAMQDYYYAVDLPFRKWLQTLDPQGKNDQDIRDRKAEEWQKTAGQIALKLGEELVNDAGEGAFTGHWIKNGRSGEDLFYSTPSEYNRFRGRIRWCLNIQQITKERPMGEKKEIGAFMTRRMKRWEAEKDEHILRAELANLRRGVGKRPGELPELWGLLFQDFPERLMSHGGEATRAEWAVSGALTLYALHQQGAGQGVNMHQEGIGLGKALARLAGQNDEDRRKAVQRRFNAFATARQMPECMTHLRGLIQLLRSKDIPLDYVRLAEDLYDFQDKNQVATVRLHWGEEFYWNMFKTEERKDENHE